MIFSSHIFLECSTSVTLPSDIGQTACTLGSSCTKVSCCMNIVEIGRPVLSYIDIDPCDQKMLISVESFTFQIDLLDYEFGLKEHFYIGIIGFE